MRVLEVKELTLPDNLNRSPNVVPMPIETFTATVTWEAAAEIKRIFSDADGFNEEC